MVRLSERMEAVAALVACQGVLADVGCDHGYIPIALVQRGRIRRAIAMDIRRGPLSRAGENIAAAGLSRMIETRLSDGVGALSPGEADSIVIAGMGGELILHILSEGKAVCARATELILQPQSDVEKVRRYLRQHGFGIDAEDMVCEDGKYYPMFRALPCADEIEKSPGEDAVLADDRYGALLLEQANPVLRAFLEKERRQLVHVMEQLKAQPDSDAIRARAAQVREQLACNELAYTRLGAKGNEGV